MLIIKNMQILKYKYRLMPNNEQLGKLRQICGSQRFIWNHFLNEEMGQYKLDKTFNFSNQNCLDLTQFKKTTPWLYESPSCTLQQTLRNLDRSLKQSFKQTNNKKGFPKFKRKRHNTGSFTLIDTSIKSNIKGDKFYIPKVGLVNWICHRDVPSEFKSLTIKEEAGKWFVVLTVQKKKAPKRKINTSVGIDLNSKEYVLFDGTEHKRYDIPKPLRENQTKIKMLQRKLAKKQKGSNNRKKTQLKLQRTHHHIANTRRDFFHKLSFELVKDYDLICLEDLNVKGIQMKMGRVTQDNMFGGFRQMVEYKTELYGSHVSVIDRWYPSSQTCSGCGGIQKMPLNLRTYDCKHCGVSLDRDENASVNIRRAGTARIAFGDDKLLDQAVVFGQLADIYEEGSHVTQ